VRSQSELILDYEQWKQFADAAGNLRVDEVNKNGRVVEQDVPNIDGASNFQIPPERAAEWGERYLDTYSKATRIAATATEIKNFADGFRDSGGFDPLDLDERGQRLAQGLSNGAATALSDKMDVDPELVSVTIETLEDGRITEAEVNSMCTRAGQVIGGVACQAFGIPAPIGAMVGGIAGKVLSGIVGGLFAGNEPSLFDIQKAQAEADSKAWTKWLNSTVKPKCKSAAEEYAKELKFLVERQLAQNLDQIQDDLKDSFGYTGGEVSLLWFDHDKWFLPDYASGVYTGLKENKELLRKQPGVENFRYLSDGGRVVTLNYPHCYDPFGCPFPDMKVDEYNDWAQNEVANALAYYGLFIGDTYEAQQAMCKGWPEYTPQDAFRDQSATHLVAGMRPRLASFVDRATTIAKEPSNELRRLLIASKLVGQDIVRTGSSARTQLKIQEDQFILADAGIATQQDWSDRKVARNILGNGAMVVGGGVLLYALYDAWKRGRL